ncbi:MAG: RNA polymerase sigma-70 factor [Bacteroidota bacterium]
MAQNTSTDFTKEDLKEAYDTYFDSLRGFLFYKTGNIELAEDIVQEVFIKVWEKRSNIEQKTLKSLLYTMAGNLMINHINHLKVISKHEDTAKTGIMSERESPQFIMEEKEFEEKLNNCLASMPGGCREVFLMNRIDKLKYEEIAEILKISIKAVEKRMSKALRIVKQQIRMKV